MRRPQITRRAKERSTHGERLRCDARPAGGRRRSQKTASERLLVVSALLRRASRASWSCPWSFVSSWLRVEPWLRSLRPPQGTARVPERTVVSSSTTSGRGSGASFRRAERRRDRQDAGRPALQVTMFYETARRASRAVSTTGAAGRTVTVLRRGDPHHGVDALRRCPGVEGVRLRSEPGQFRGHTYTCPAATPVTETCRPPWSARTSAKVARPHQRR